MTACLQVLRIARGQAGTVAPHAHYKEAESILALPLPDGFELEGAS